MQTHWTTFVFEHIQLNLNTRTPIAWIFGNFKEILHFSIGFNIKSLFCNSQFDKSNYTITWRHFCFLNIKCPLLSNFHVFIYLFFFSPEFGLFVTSPSINDVSNDCQQRLVSFWGMRIWYGRPYLDTQVLPKDCYSMWPALPSE